MKNDKRLSPKIKIGCSKCNKIKDEDLEISAGGFKLSTPKSTKVTSIIKSSIIILI